eukprot:880662-Pyramimonas_sp.AAC.1
MEFRSMMAAVVKDTRRVKNAPADSPRTRSSERGSTPPGDGHAGWEELILPAGPSMDWHAERTMDRLKQFEDAIGANRAQPLLKPVPPQVVGEVPSSA